MNTRSLLFAILVAVVLAGGLGCGKSETRSVDGGDARADQSVPRDAWLGPDVLPEPDVVTKVADTIPSDGIGLIADGASPDRSGDAPTGADVRSIDTRTEASSPTDTPTTGGGDGGLLVGDVPAAEGQPRFAQGIYAATLPMGYAKEVRVTITGGKPGTWAVARVEAEFDDLALDFVGPGSEDSPLELGAKPSVEVVLSVSSPDAARKNYQIPIALYLLTDPDDDIVPAARVSTAFVDLTLRFPVVNLEARKVSEDPASLAQTWHVVNKGDDISDLYIVGRGLFETQMTIAPEPEHVELAAGEVFEFVVTPALFPGMKSLAGQIEIQAGDQVQTVPITFAVPEGKRVFIGFGASWFSQHGFGTSWFNQQSGGSFCTNQGRIQMDLGRGPRRPKASDANPGGSDFWSKKGMADAYAKSTKEGMAAGKTMKIVSRASWLTVPFIALESVFKGIAKAIGKDPPDANYKVVVVPDLRTPSTVLPDDTTELTQEGADALNALIANGTLIADLGRAIVATQDKLGGAQAASDTEWVRKHEIVFRAYAAMIAERIRVHAELTSAFVDVAPGWFGIPFADDVAAMQEELAASGFEADEIAAFKDFGLTDEDISEMKADILAADPEQVAALTFTDLVNRLWSADDDSPADLGRVFELAAMTAVESQPIEAHVLVRYELESPREYITPHTTTIWCNDQEIATFSQRILEGLYVFPMDVSKVKFFGILPSGNDIQILSEDLNEGSFVRTLDVTLYTRHALYGQLVVATTQEEANSLAGSSTLMNRDRPDLVLLANKFPSFAADAFDGSKPVSLLLTVYNMGEAASAATTLSVFGEDPRLGSPGPSLVSPVAVPGIEASARTDVTVVLPTSLLTSEDVPQRLFISVAPDGNKGDFQPSNNTMVLNLR